MIRLVVFGSRLRFSVGFRIRRTICSTFPLKNAVAIPSHIALNKTEKQRSIVNPRNLKSLERVLELLLADIEIKLRERTIDAPFIALNKLPSDNITMLLAQFKLELLGEFTNYYMKDNVGSRKVEDIKLNDYLNPQLKDATQIILLIHLRRYPQSILEHFNIATHLQFISFVCTRLFYKSYVNYVITHTPSL